MCEFSLPLEHVRELLKDFDLRFLRSAWFGPWETSDGLKRGSFCFLQGPLYVGKYAKPNSRRLEGNGSLEISIFAIVRAGAIGAPPLESAREELNLHLRGKENRIDFLTMNSCFLSFSGRRRRRI